jgi:hypothetical protein
MVCQTPAAGLGTLAPSAPAHITRMPYHNCHRCLDQNEAAPDLSTGAGHIPLT